MALKMKLSREKSKASPSKEQLQDEIILDLNHQVRSLRRRMAQLGLIFTITLALEIIRSVLGLIVH